MNNFVAEQFGANLRYCRRRAKLSQEELSFQAGLHRVTVGLLERGERICRIDTLVKLAGALGVSSAELLDGLEWQPGAMVAGSFHFDGEGGP
jgi:transcriptional regulator with XRE-family HTH domain